MRPESVRRARQAPGLSAVERVILSELTDLANTDTGLAWPARETLCAATGQSARTVSRALSDLIALGYVSEVERARPGRTRVLRVNVSHIPVLDLPRTPRAQDAPDPG